MPSVECSQHSAMAVDSCLLISKRNGVDTSCTWDSCCKALTQALTHLPIKAGSRLEHYMYNGPFGSSLEVMAGEGLRARGPRLLSTSQLPGWKHCSLWVTACEVSRHAVGWLKPCTV